MDEGIVLTGGGDDDVVVGELGNLCSLKELGFQLVDIVTRLGTNAQQGNNRRDEGVEIDLVGFVADDNGFFAFRQLHEFLGR